MRVHRDRLDRLGPRVQQEQLEPLDRPEQRARPDRLVLRGQREPLDRPEHPVPQEQPVRLDLLDLPDRPGLKAQLVLKGQPGREAFRPI